MSDPTNFFGVTSVVARSAPRQTLVLQYDVFGELPPIDSVSDGTVALVKANRTVYEAGATAWVSRGAFAGSNVHVVQHGSSAAHERPAFGTVFWVGNVEPANAQDNDVWFDTTP